jgi:hypothetical protein
MKYLLFAVMLTGLPQVPDAKLTPGAILNTANKETVCVVGYTKTVRDVPVSVKRKVFANYGIDPTSSKFEIDHLISLELGGSNDIKNLWPQSYLTTPYNAHMKDRLENLLHRMVCSGQISLSQAQSEISTNWIGAYNKYIK